MPEFEPRLLYRRWVHAHEEDTGRQMVFRPAEVELPPSRGRAAFELRPDGTFAESGIGPTDRPEPASGTWELEFDVPGKDKQGDFLTVSYPPGTVLYKDTGFQGYEPVGTQTRQAKKKATPRGVNGRGKAHQPEVGTHPGQGGACPGRGEALARRQGRLAEHQGGGVRFGHGGGLWVAQPSGSET